MSADEKKDRNFWIEFKDGVCYKLLMARAEEILNTAEKKNFEIERDEDAMVDRRVIRGQRDLLNQLQTYVLNSCNQK